jgi:DNA-binding XRE family transcriptional regulator
MTELGEFLRARRELVLPAERGLPDSGRRRVRGLRREEVAMLAGISAEYYIRLERGRDRHPSMQVIQALAGVLDLDADSIAHLAMLAAPRPRTPAVAPGGTEQVAPGAAQLLAAMPDTPVIVLGRFLDVLAHTPATEILYGYPPTGTNNLRAVFLDPAAPARFPDWEDVAAECVAALRASSVDATEDPRLIALVGELSLKSADFRRLWARHEVRPKAGGRKRMVSPVVGEVPHRWETFATAGAPGQLVVASFPLSDDPASVLAFEHIARVARDRAAGQA